MTRDEFRRPPAPRTNAGKENGGNETMLELDRIHHADAFDLLPSIADGSVDLVVCDGPYGVTANAWDRVGGGAGVEGVGGFIASRRSWPARSHGGAPISPPCAPCRSTGASVRPASRRS